MCSRGKCTFKCVDENVYECVHGTKHLCDATCELAVYSTTGATFACPVSGVAKETAVVTLEGSGIVSDDFVEEDDCMPRVLLIVNTVMPQMDEFDRFAVAHEIARVRNEYLRRSKQPASLVSHTLAILYQMKDDGWRCSGTQVIHHDELVAKFLCGETELEHLNGVVSCSMKDITKGSTYIMHALERTTPAAHHRRVVSFVENKRVVPESMIIRPRNVVKLEIERKFKRSKDRYTPDTKRSKFDA